jgi:hypothetical protein
VIVSAGLRYGACVLQGGSFRFSDRLAIQQDGGDCFSITIGIGNAPDMKKK